MKAFLVVVFIAASCVLGYLLLDAGNKSEKQKIKYETTISEKQDEIDLKDRKLREQVAATQDAGQQVAALEQQLEIATTSLASATNQVTALEAEVVKVAAVAAKAEQEIAVRDAKITELQGERDDLTKQMTGLNEEIVRLETRISSTEGQLTAARGDRAFLLKELTRMQAEKAELERQFTDLVVLREQVSRLQSELAVARRVDLIRSGRYGGQNMKGAQLLRSGQFERESAATGSYDLEVEIKADGSAPVVQTNRLSNGVTPLN